MLLEFQCRVLFGGEVTAIDSRRRLIIKLIWRPLDCDAQVTLSHFGFSKFRGREVSLSDQIDTSVSDLEADYIYHFYRVLWVRTDD